MKIPDSSWHFLRRFRLPNKPRILWMDAICINQNDNAERAGQVALSDEIYTKTVHNLIWLGYGDATTNLALECIKRIVDDMRVETDTFANARELLYGGRLGLNLVECSNFATMISEDLPGRRQNQNY